jgi:hypothetical protein
MLFLTAEQILQFFHIRSVTSFTLFVAWILQAKIALLIFLFGWVIVRRILRTWARRRDQIFRTRFLERIRTDPESISWKDFSLLARATHALKIHKGQIYFFRRLIVDESKIYGRGARQKYLFGLYERFGFLDEDLMALKKGLWFKRLSAIVRLESFQDDRLVPHFLRSMEDDHDLIALVALRALSRMSFEDKAGKILETLSRRAPSRRDVFAEILMNLGAEYRHSIIHIVTHCYDPYIASVGLSVLGRLNVKEALPLCLSLLKSSDDEVVAESVTALERIGSADLVQEIRPLLEHDSILVRRRVLHALRALKDIEWKKFAEKSLEDKSAEVRREAYELLRHDIRYV